MTITVKAHNEYLSAEIHLEKEKKSSSPNLMNDYPFYVGYN